MTGDSDDQVSRLLEATLRAFDLVGLSIEDKRDEFEQMLDLVPEDETKDLLRAALTLAAEQMAAALGTGKALDYVAFVKSKRGPV
jgi:hypothetical protein